MFNCAVVLARCSAIVGMAIALLTSTGCTQSSSEVPRGNGPPLVCNNASYDFGRVAPGRAAALTHTFVVRNTTDHSVSITAVNCSCGCTAATAAPLVIPPRQRARITAVAHWADHVGPQIVSILVRVRDGRDGPLILWVKGFVTSTTAAVPSQVNFGRLEPGQVRSRIITICAGTEDASDVRIERVTGLPANASYILRPGEAYGMARIGKPGSAADVAITFRGLPNADKQNRWARVRLVGGGAVSIRYRAFSPGIIIVAPSRILMTGGGGTVVKMNLKLFTWGDGRAVVRSPPGIGPPWFSLHIANIGPPVKTGRRWVHRFRITCAFHGRSGHYDRLALSAEFRQYQMRIPLVLMEYP